MAQNREIADISHIDSLEKMALEISSEECFSRSALKINGTDLIKNGLGAGRQLGIILNALLTEVIEEKIPNEREVLLKRAIEIKNDCD